MSSLLVVGGLVGCTTTQQTATRMAVRSERELASRKPIDVKRIDPDVRVVSSSVIRGVGGGAIAVTLRNDGKKPVNDLPLAVGVKTPGGGTTYLNDQGHLPYFQAHAPALAPGEQSTWVYTTTKGLPAGSPIAKVGVIASPPVTTASGVPELDVKQITSSDAKGKKSKPPTQPTVEVEVANPTGMPQYDLAVYAWATKGGRYVAAGQGSTGDLSTGDTATVKVKLVGNPEGAEVHVAAPSTIFE